MRYFYWLFVIALVSVQLFFTLHSTSQIRYEELAEAVRNPFWLSHGLVYDGVSSNVGWYGSLFLIYKTLGFNLFTAKFFRVVLHVVSIACAALILRRFIGEKKAIVPLLVISLSPTLLFLNTLQTSFGIDLQYFPIVLWLILNMDVKNGLMRLSAAAGAGIISMLAWMSYPTFIFYLPGLAALSWWRLQNKNKLQTIVVGMLGFLLPLVIAFSLVQNRSLLFYDNVVQSGIFRGAGGSGFSGSSFAASLGGLTRDLFDKGASYHFEIASGEFSYILPIISFLFVVGVGFALSKNKSVKLPVILTLTTFFGSLFLAGLTNDPSNAPGMRRYTVVLAMWYVLYVFAWSAITRGKMKFDWKLGLLLLVLVHHLIVLPINFMHLGDASLYQENLWLETQKTPSESLANWVQKAQSTGVSFACLDAQKRALPCRYPEIYAAVAGSCEWNHLSCKNIEGYDLRTGKFIPLSVDLWENYYFDH